MRAPALEAGRPFGYLALRASSRPAGANRRDFLRGKWSGGVDEGGGGSRGVRRCGGSRARRERTSFFCEGAASPRRRWKRAVDALDARRGSEPSRRLARPGLRPATLQPRSVKVRPIARGSARRARTGARASRAARRRRGARRARRPRRSRGARRTGSCCACARRSSAGARRPWAPRPWARAGARRRSAGARRPWAPRPWARAGARRSSVGARRPWAPRPSARRPSAAARGARRSPGPAGARRAFVWGF